MAAISISPIRRGRRIVLAETHLQLPDEGTIGLIGPNGAGKTSLMLALAGLLRSRPEVRFDGIAAPPIGFLGQTPRLPEWLTGREVLELYGGASALDTEQTFLQPLLPRRVAEMSTGQRHMLAIVATLVLRRPLTLLDEPFATLDLLNRRLAIQLLHEEGRANDRGRLRLISSQSPADLHEICQYLIVLRQGQLVFQGGWSDLSGGKGRPSLTEFEERILSLFGASR